eukprot:CAMPEP_0196771006 /NCGR_PEP_ID=MMETSP1104-20130614/1454_1 /TAXON_ID=33652 /ORGANISM="Cafeteria sp., Strain Caron Lab Isolate" /LENGTH=310 /DNA_ID=CAMNT_0042141121 /DNA_START=148 /DNA_END=1076 /DNA_ORIENTATION=+
MPLQLLTSEEDLRSSKMRVLRITTLGEAEELEMGRGEIATATRLKLRDLRVLDTKFMRSRMPIILPRQSALIVSLEHVKVIVMHNYVWVFDPWNPAARSMANSLRGRIETSYPHRSTPFEFLVLEETLDSVCDVLDRRLHTLSAAIATTLEAVNEDVNERNLARLLPLKNSLASFDVQVHEVRSAIQDLLENDEDLAAMYLTTKAMTGQPQEVTKHDEAEVLLEEYLKQVEEITNELRELHRNIEATEAVINIELSHTRNRIMRLDLILTTATFSVSLGAFGAGLFGMNLVSHMEDHPSAFYIVAGAFIA